MSVTGSYVFEAQHKLFEVQAVRFNRPNLDTIDSDLWLVSVSKSASDDAKFCLGCDK